MARLSVAGGLTDGGRYRSAFRQAAFAAYGDTCHLCGEPGATTIDHLKPIKTNPELRWDLANVRPAHLSCNSSRQDRPFTGEWAAAW